MRTAIQANGQRIWQFAAEQFRPVDDPRAQYARDELMDRYVLAILLVNVTPFLAPMTLYSPFVLGQWPGGPSYEQWAALRNCESSGNYQAVSPSGLYRGAYQFDLSTWASVGGSGDPAVASPEEQDHRAQVLWSQRGSSPWPVCGRYLD